MASRDICKGVGSERPHLCAVDGHTGYPVVTLWGKAEGRVAAMYYIDSAARSDGAMITGCCRDQVGCLLKHHLDGVRRPYIA